MLVARQVLRHLIEFPNAVDTAAGILQWWLKAGNEITDQTELEGILEVMVDRGWLVETKIGSFSKLYGVNERCLEEIRSFLDTTTDAEGPGN